MKEAPAMLKAPPHMGMGSPQERRERYYRNTLKRLTQENIELRTKLEAEKAKARSLRSRLAAKTRRQSA